MTFVIEKNPAFDDNLFAILKFIANDSPNNVRKFKSKIDRTIKNLSNMPFKFRKCKRFNLQRIYKDDALKILRALHNRFNKYKLQLHPNKTRVFSFGRFEKQNASSENRKPNTFDFLGFTHYCDKTRKGHFKVGRKTSAKKFRAKAKDLNLWFKHIRNHIQTKDWWKVLSLKLQGHYEYYGISENYRFIFKFYKLAIRLAKKWLDRRSQKQTMSWENMEKYLGFYPLPKPSIRHSFYTLSHNV